MSSLLKPIIFIFLLFSIYLLCVNGHGHSHHHSHVQDEHPSFKYSKQANEHSSSSKLIRTSSETLTLWIEAITSTLLISAAPFFILFFIPLNNRVEHEPRLKVLLSFASGGLLGDAFLHLIPHALLSHSADSHSHSHSHDKQDAAGHDLSIGLGVLGGIVTFLMVEKFVRIVKGGHSHSHSAVNIEKNPDNKDSDQCLEDNDQKIKEKDSDKGGDITEKSQECSSVKSDAKATETDDGDIKVAGYLNLAADFTHNFTDGLAIGASFLAGRSVGIITTITILLHEVPHEIGDFAILIQSGCSKKKAILLQSLTAVGALAGTSLSLFAEGVDERVSKLILPFTAGGFIYIATVSVIPELLENTKFWQSVKEIFALLAGVFMMVLIAQYE